MSALTSLFSSLSLLSLSGALRRPYHPAPSPLEIFITIILPKVFPFLDLATLYEVTRVSHGLRVAIQTHLRCQVHRTLGRWFQDPLGFRACMRNNQAVLSGSAALATILHVTWDPNDLDVYVPRAYKFEVVKYLVLQEGYRPAHPDDASYQYPPIAKSAIWSITRLRKTADDGTPRYIDIIQSATPSPYTPIAAFSGTWTMNWIEADQLVVSYPRLTLRSQGFITRPREHLQSTESRWVEKYEARGFGVFDPRNQPIKADQPCGPSCVALLRITSDIYSLCMSIDVARDIPEKEGCAWVLFPHFLEARSCGNPFCPLSPLYDQNVSSNTCAVETP